MGKRILKKHGWSGNEPIRSKSSQETSEEKAERVEQMCVGTLEVVVAYQVPLRHYRVLHHLKETTCTIVVQPGLLTS